MKRTVKLTILFVFFLAGTSYAQRNNASVFLKLASDGSPRIIPWYMGNHAIFIDTRYGFDQAGAVGIFIGKAFWKGDFATIPEIGTIIGDSYEALAPEVVLIDEGRTTSFFSLSTLAFGIQGSGFAYNLTEVTWKTKAGFDLGLMEQVFYPYTPETEIDVGVVLKVAHRNLYSKAWITASPLKATMKAAVGTGVVF